jgi:hypothetical protein
MSGSQLVEEVGLGPARLLGTQERGGDAAVELGAQQGERGAGEGGAGLGDPAAMPLLRSLEA